MDFLKRRFYKIIIHLKATLQYHNVGKILLFFQHYLHLFICCKIKFFTGWFYYRIKYFLQNDLFTECIFFFKMNIFQRGEKCLFFIWIENFSFFSFCMYPRSIYICFSELPPSHPDQKSAVTLMNFRMKNWGVKTEKQLLFLKLNIKINGF